MNTRKMKKMKKKREDYRENATTEQIHQIYNSLSIKDLAEILHTNTNTIIRTVAKLKIKLLLKSQVSYADASRIQLYLKIARSNYSGKPNYFDTNNFSLNFQRNELNLKRRLNELYLTLDNQMIELNTRKKDSLISKVSGIDLEPKELRVYELGEKLAFTSTTIIAIGNTLNITLKSPQSIISNSDLKRIEDFILNNGKVTKKIKPDTKKIKPDTKNEVQSNVNNKRKNFNSALMELKNKFISDTVPIKKEKLELDKFPDIEINISNLKTIKNFTWNIDGKQSLYVLIGENGVGKSSILQSLAKFVQPNIFKEELCGKGFEETVIEYKINDSTIRWVKDPYWKQKSDDNIEMPKLNGFLESSVLTGTRFKHIDKYTREDLEVRESEDKKTKADPFIIENMNYILNGDNKKTKGKFNNLYEISAIRKRKTLDTKKLKPINFNFYALKNKDNYIKEFFFSTGEYFLLSLLKFILDNKSNKSNIPAFIIIDEIELSLHPLAQKRLIEKIYNFTKTFNLLIVFATHSLQVIESTKPEHLYYIKKGKTTNNHTISNPIYSGYLTSRLYNHQYFDRIILVEDTCAKHFVNFIIEELNLTSIKLTSEVIPIGDCKKVLDTAKDNLNSAFYGKAKVLAIIDDDVKDLSNTDAYSQVNTTHIPVKENVERYILELLRKEDEDLISYIDAKISPSNYDDLKIVIKDENKSSYIKSVFSALLAAIADFGSRSNNSITKHEAENYIIKFIYNQVKDNQDCIEFKNRLKAFYNR